MRAFEVPVCATTETRGIEMAFLVKISWTIVSAISQLFQGEPKGFEQVFDNLTSKHMDALMKQIQSLVDYVLNHCFWT